MNRESLYGTRRARQAALNDTPETPTKAETLRNLFAAWPNAKTDNARQALLSNYAKATR
jgi:hypothetical protein